MTMTAREIALIGCLALLMLLLPAAASAQPGPPAWNARTVMANVPLGSPVEVLVTGPPNGTFSVQLSEYPFNQSVPVASGTFVLPDAASLPNDTAEGVAKLNTTYLGIETDQIAVSESGATFAFGIVNITVPLNDSYLADEVENLSYEVAIDNLREQSLLYATAQEETDLIVSVAVTVVSAAAVALVFLFTRSALGETRPIRRLQRLGHAVSHSKGYIQNTGPAEIPLRRAPPTTRANYYCRLCLASGFTREEVIQHNRSVESVKEPKLNRDYAVEAARAARDAATIAEARPPLPKREPAAAAPVDLFPEGRWDSRRNDHR